MIATTGKTVRELALEIPNATRVFEKLGIDYCCGGTLSLEEACRAANLSAEQVLQKLEEGGQTTAQPERNWQGGMLTELIDHIKATHHKFVREETARIKPLLDKVCKVHGENHHELLAIREVFGALAAELAQHLMKEEMILFPYIVRMEEATLQQEPALPAPFGSVQNPIHAMIHEHDSAGDALRKLRELSNNYVVPSDGCFSYGTLFQALAGFEADLHQHIHLENNVLFPRAVEMESAAKKLKV